MSYRSHRPSWDVVKDWLLLGGVPTNELPRYQAYYESPSIERAWALRQEGLREVAIFLLHPGRGLAAVQDIFREYFSEYGSRQKLRRELVNEGSRYQRYHTPEGYLGGLEEDLIAQAFHGLPDAEPIFSSQPACKSEIVEVHRRPRDAWHFLYAHAANPYSPCQFMVDFTLACMKQSSHSFHVDGHADELFSLLVHFVEPRGSVDSISPVRRYRDALLDGMQKLGRQDILDALAQCQSPLGRFNYDPDWEGVGWDDRLAWIHPEDEHETVDLNMFEPRVVHGGRGMDYLSQFAGIYDELGFSDKPFDVDSVRRVDISAIVTEEFLAEFGFEPGDALLASWYRVETNGKFQCSVLDESKLYIDLFAFDESNEAAPSLLMLPRFGAFYALRNPLLSAALNERSARRLAAERFGMVLRRYRPELVVSADRNPKVVAPIVREFEALDPYFPAAYYPTDPMLAAEDDPSYPECN